MTEILKITNTKIQTIKIAILNVLVELSKTMSGEMVTYFFEILGFIKKCFDSETSSSLQIPSFIILEYLIIHDKTAIFTPHIEVLLYIILKGIKCDNFVIINEAL